MLKGPDMEDGLADINRSIISWRLDNGFDYYLLLLLSMYLKNKISIITISVDISSLACSSVFFSFQILSSDID